MREYLYHMFGQASIHPRSSPDDQQRSRMDRFPLELTLVIVETGGLDVEDGLAIRGVRYTFYVPMIMTIRRI